MINGAQACNVFWKVEGLVSMAAGTTMRGTVVANNAAIHMSIGDTLEGRALSTTGAITLNGAFAYTPIGCGSPILNGPAAPTLGAVACYALFSANGPVSNSGLTSVIGDIGTNTGLCSGFDSLLVTGTIHPIPDGSTSLCASDLNSVYSYLNSLPVDIELLYPAQFGNGLVLTPHTYLLNAATVLTDSLYLDAMGNSNAIFVIKINGAFSTSTYSKVLLRNGAQTKNVYWKVEGAVGINDYSVFRGTLICNNGAVGALNTGVTFYGRALTTNGALTTTAITVQAKSLPGNCSSVNIAKTENSVTSANIYPNPFKSSPTLWLPTFSNYSNVELKLFDVLGNQVQKIEITKSKTILETSNLSDGIYFYQISGDAQILHFGKLISQH